MRRRAAGDENNDAGMNNDNEQQDGSGNLGSGAGEGGEDEKSEMPDPRQSNTIGNAEEIEAEQSEMNFSGPNVGSPAVRMQA